MNLFDSINRRKSCRSYIDQPLSEAQLQEIKDAINEFEPLYPNIPLEHRFITETKGLLKSKAPHYLIISGQGKEGEAENAGFLFQQLILWFDAHDIGCVWLGEAKDAEQNSNGKDLITIAFGKANGSLHRKESEFKRKPINEITNDPKDPCIQAAHLAPSGMNLQPWYFEKVNDKIILYKQKLKPPVSFIYKKTDLDMGITLCHYALACKQFGKSFAFHRKREETNKKGYYLFGEIQMKK